MFVSIPNGALLRVWMMEIRPTETMVFIKSPDSGISICSLGLCPALFEAIVNASADAVFELSVDLPDLPRSVVEWGKYMTVPSRCRIQFQARKV